MQSLFPPSTSKTHLLPRVASTEISSLFLLKKKGELRIDAIKPWEKDERKILYNLVGSSKGYAATHLWSMVFHKLADTTQSRHALGVSF